MKYKPTLLNIAAIALLIADNYIHWSAYAAGEVAEYSFIGLLLSVLIGCTGLVIDYILQRAFKNYWLINAMELALLLLVSGVYFHNTREKTIVVPQDVTGAFTIVYGVRGADPLFTSYPVFGYKLETGGATVLYTGTPFDEDIWNTEFQTAYWPFLKMDGFGRSVTDFTLGQVNCKGEAWKYRTWLVKKGGYPIENKGLDSIIASKISSHCSENH